MMRQNQINNEYQYIVATDIAARGIDIDGVSHVIKYAISKQNLIFIFIEVDVQGVENYTGICYSMYDTTDEKKILQFLKEKELNLRICNLKTDNLWI